MGVAMVRACVHAGIGCVRVGGVVGGAHPVLRILGVMVPRRAIQSVLHLQNRINDQLGGVLVGEPVEDLHSVLPGRYDRGQA